MAGPPIHHVDVRAFRYATEVPERVEAAFAVVYPPLASGEAALERSTGEGHYGHDIDVYSLRLTTRSEIDVIVECLRSSADLPAILDQLSERVTDECDLFVRFDKQRAYADGELVLGDGIELRLRLEAYPARREAAIENARAFFGDEAAG